MSTKRNQKGFTLIEVVLVLAIGGLIFLLAFLAFGQVSVNRRDTQRKSDAGRMLAELENWQGDNSAYPATPTAALTATNLCTGAVTNAVEFSNFLKSYVCKDGKFSAPGGASYTTSTTDPAAKDVIRYGTGLRCAVAGTPGSTATGATASNVVIVIGSEKGTSVCRDNT